MKELVVVSGKGGTGKTSISAALAYIAQKKVLADCDVDASNFHLISDAVVLNSSKFTSGFEPYIDSLKCTHCGLCTNLCRFGAINSGVIKSCIACEGCGVCASHCPSHAIIMREKHAGQWFISQTRFGPLVHSELGLAIESSGKLVSKVRQEAKRISQERSLPLIIIDGPPGIGCPTIAALTGASLVLAVIEPSFSGIHDFKKLVELTEHFKIPTAVCINKSTLNPDNTKELESWCKKKNLPVIGCLPYSDTFRNSLRTGKTVMETCDKEIKACIVNMWCQLVNLLDLRSQLQLHDVSL